MLGLGRQSLRLGLGKIVVLNSQEIEAGWHPLRRTERPALIGGQPQAPVGAQQKHANLIAHARRSTAQAFYDPASRTTVFVADRIASGTEQGVFLHEMTHKHGRTLLGAQAFKALTDQVVSWRSSRPGSREKAIYTAAARMATQSDSGHHDDELFAYAVENAVRLGITPSAAAHAHSAEKWLSTVISSLEAITTRLIGQPHSGRSALNPQDIVDLAYALAQVETSAHAQSIRQALNALSSSPAPDESPDVTAVPQPPAPIWFSALSKAISNLPDQSAPAEQWINLLRGLSTKGVKRDEIEWSGVQDWLALQPGRIAKSHLVHYLDENGVKVEEKMLGATTPEWQFNAEQSQWERGQYVIDFGTAWVNLYAQDANGACEGHVRKFFGSQALEQAKAFIAPQSEDDTEYGDHVLPAGQNYRELILTLPAQTPVLFISSHWEEANVLAHIRFNERTDTEGKKVLFIEEIQSDWGQVGREKGFTPAVPSLSAQALKLSHRFLAYPSALPEAPFVQKTDAWVGLCIKRMLRYAVDNDFERIAFISGEQIVERFKLKLGSDGLRDFYDAIVPGIAKKVIRGLGSEALISTEVFFGPDENSPGDAEGEGPVTSFQTAFDITPQMRECVLRGLPLFSMRDEVPPEEPYEEPSAEQTFSPG